MPASRITAGDVAGTIALFVIFLLGAFFACLLDGGEAMAQAPVDCAALSHAALDRDDATVFGFALIGMMALAGHALATINGWGR